MIFSYGMDYEKKSVGERNIKISETSSWRSIYFHGFH